jgi:hypothetical protein
MGLAQVTVEPDDFDTIRQHLTNHMPAYLNMHLREACQRDGERDLRYLHAMYAPPGKPNLIEGAISGPSVYWRYEIRRTPNGTQLNVITERGPVRALKRIEKRFTIEILRRIEQEKAGMEHYPTLTSGQFYLRRRKPGSSSTHRTCTRAVGAQMLAKEFVELLVAWNLVLLCP